MILSDFWGELFFYNFISNKYKIIKKKKSYKIFLLVFIFIIIPFYADAKLLISEIMYNPPSSINENILKDEDYEWIELLNNAAEPLNVNGYKISAGNADFPDSAIKFELSEDITLPPMGFLIIARNAKIFDASNKQLPYHFSLTRMCPVIGLNEYERMQKYIILHNKGCEIRVYDNYGNLSDSVNYLSGYPWPISYNSSIERINFNEDGNNPLNWKSIRDFNYFGSPGVSGDLNIDSVSVVVLNDAITAGEPEEIFVQITNKTSSYISRIDIEVPENLKLIENIPDNNQGKKTGERKKINKKSEDFKSKIKFKGNKKKNKTGSLENTVEFSDIVIKPFSSEIVSLGSLDALEAGMPEQSKNKLNISARFVSNNQISKYDKSGIKVYLKGDGSGIIKIFPESFVAGKYYKQPLKITFTNKEKTIIDTLRIAFPANWEWSGLQNSVKILGTQNSKIKLSIIDNKKEQVYLLLENCNLNVNEKIELELNDFRTYNIVSTEKIPQTLFSVMSSEKGGILKAVENIYNVKLLADSIKAAHIVIQEVMYYPACEEKDKRHNNWIKLYNPTDNPIKINNWRLYDSLPESNKEGIWIIPNKPEFIIKPNAEFIICADADFYIAKYNKKPDIEANTDNSIKQGKKKVIAKEKDNPIPNLNVVGDFQLSAKGDDVILVDDNDKVIDAVCWGRKSSLKMQGSRNIVCEEDQYIRRIQPGYESNEKDSDEYSEIIENAFEVK
ncbi:lamin tail domain-containing protein [Candidatus Dependentiae bacterium]|nr:lamin tail domain-containing protein [Candidatus Dependentiae bacterium]